MVKHVLKDGTVLEEITGHVVKKEDALLVYQIMERMKKEKEGKGGKSRDRGKKKKKRKKCEHLPRRRKQGTN